MKRTALIAILLLMPLLLAQNKRPSTAQQIDELRSEIADLRLTLHALCDEHEQLKKNSIAMAYWMNAYIRNPQATQTAYIAAAPPPENEIAKEIRRQAEANREQERQLDQVRRMDEERRDIQRQVDEVNRQYPR